MTTSSTYFGVLVCVIGFLDPSINDPSSRTILLPNSNSNWNPFIDFGLLGGTCSSAGLNSSKAGHVTTFSFCSLIACRPSCVYYWFCYKCYSKCCKCRGLVVVSIQSSYTFPSKCRCSSPFGNLVLCSSLTSWLYSFNSLSCGDVICGTSCLYSLDHVSCGIIICGISLVCPIAYTTIGITLTTVGIANGSILPLIIFYALRYVFSYSLFILELEVPPSSTLFFLLRTLFGESIAAFFLFSNVVYISSLVILTLVGSFCGFSL